MEITAQDLEKFEAKLTDGKHKLAEKAAQDASFHDALTKNPKETIEKFFELPAGTLKDVSVDIIEEKPKTIGIVIPPRHQDGAELSEAQLEAVAGGAIFVASAAPIAVGLISGIGLGVGLPAAAGLKKGW